MKYTPLYINGTMGIGKSDIMIRYAKCNGIFGFLYKIKYMIEDIINGRN